MVESWRQGEISGGAEWELTVLFLATGEHRIIDDEGPAMIGSAQVASVAAGFLTSDVEFISPAQVHHGSIMTLKQSIPTLAFHGPRRSLTQPFAIRGLFRTSSRHAVANCSIVRLFTTTSLTLLHPLASPIPQNGPTLFRSKDFAAPRIAGVHSRARRSQTIVPRAPFSPLHVHLSHLYSRARRKNPCLCHESYSSRSQQSSVRDGPTSKAQHAKGNGPGAAAGASSNTQFLRSRLPDISNRFHRPTRDELLAAATGFWSRLRVRFKWFSIRSVRPFNSDDISAFFSWILVGHVIWILVGTTTFFSLLVFAVNTVFAQETLARWVGNYLTKSSGVSVVFESAIVPRWKDGVLSFKNVFVSRRPGKQQADFSKGSQISAAAAAAAAAAASERAQGVPEDLNYTQYDVSIDTVNVTLSFAKWFNGKGLLKDVEVKGVRGVLDRTTLHHTANYIDPRTYRHEHSMGDFELESFKMDDLLVSVYQPEGFRPFSVSVFSADLPQLRKQWLFYDLLSANHLSGSFDDSPFFIHPQQSHSQTGLPLREERLEDGTNHWKKHSRIRVDGLKVDHLNRGIEGPFSWIHEGNVDIVADVMIPADDDPSIAKVMSDFYDRMEASVTSSGNSPDESRPEANPLPDRIDSGQSNATARFLVMDLRIHLNSVHAGVPLFTRDLSYVNNALIRPIVAYINSKQACIPISCRVVKRVDEFNGSWTIYDSGLMEDLSRETYDAFARDVVDERARLRRFKKVGLWSLEMAVRALFLGLAGNMA